MICPRCHNENKYDNLTCDFCMATLPMSEKRKAEIERRHEEERKANMKKSMDKLVGLLAGVLVILAIVIWGLFFR
jgi:uncharacterized membrane protein YvbJ